MIFNINQRFEYEFNITHNLLNNLRILCQKSPEQAKLIIPKELFNDIKNGYDIPASAEYYSPTTNKFYELEFTKDLREQLGDVLVKDSKQSKIPVIQIDIEGYRVVPDGSLVAIENKNLSVKREKTELDTNKVYQNNPKDLNENERDNVPNKDKKEDKVGIGYNIRKLIIIVCILVFLIMGVAIWWFTKDTSVKDFISYLENDNYQEAINLYNDSINGNSKKEEKVNLFVEKEINEKFEQYCQDISTYDSTISILAIISEIKNLSLSELAKSKVDMVSNMESSRQTNGSQHLDSDDNDLDKENNQTIEKLSPLLKSDNYIHLSQLDCVDKSNDGDAFAYYETTIDNFGTTYVNGIGGTDGSGQSWKEYKLDGTYSELRGRVVLNYDVRTQTNDDVFLWIYGDNINLFMSQAITAGCEPQDFTVDLSGITTLKVVIQGKNMLRLVDCGLYTDSSVPTVSTATQNNLPNQSRIYLSNLEWFNASSSGGGFSYYDSVKDNFGTIYANGIGGTDGSGQSFQEYKLDGTYSELRGRVVLNYDVRTQTNDDVFLWIYGDNNVLFQSQEITAGCEPQDFTVDLSGITTLKVVIQGKNMLRLVDCGLYTDSSVPTVSTATQNNSPNQSRIYLSNLEWFNASSSSGGFNYYDSVKDNFGTVYANGIGGTDGSGQSFQEYKLDGTYSELRGRVVLNYDVRTQTNDDVFLWIYGDNNVLFQSQEITAGCESQDFTVDLSGITTLKVVIQGKNMLRLVDCGLYTDSSVSTVSTATQNNLPNQSCVYLSNLDWFNASSGGGGFRYYDSVKDNFGTVYANGIGGTDGYGQSFQEYKLDGRYSELRGRVVLNYDVRTQTNDDVFLWIYGDNNVLFQSQEITAGCEPQDFIVDLSGITTLKVVIQGENMLRLVDCGLYK